MTTPPPPPWTPPTPEQIQERSDNLGLDLSPEMFQVGVELAPGFAPLYNAVSAWWHETLTPPRDIDWTEDPDPWNATAYKFCLQNPNPTGTLAGLTLVVKESIEISGIPLGYGSRLLLGHISRKDATVISRVLAEGAAITRKGRSDDLGLAITGDQNYTGPVLNPWNTGHLTWGSSSGPAALIAAGRVDAGILVDQAGSGRMPAAGTGLLALVPGRGEIPFTGILGFTAVQDRVALVGRHTSVIARLASAVSGGDTYDLKNGPRLTQKTWRERTGCGVRGLRIGLVTESLTPERTDPEVVTAVRAQAARLTAMGATVTEVSIPRYGEAVPLALVLSVQKGVPDLLARNMGHMDSVLAGSPELVELFSSRRAEHPEWLARTVQLSAAVVGFDGGFPPGWWAAAAMEMIPHLRAAYTTHLHAAGSAGVDLLLTPTAPSPAPTVPGPDMSLLDELSRALGRGITHTCAANLTGLPAGQVPAGLVGGLPVGAMYTSAMGDEEKILRVMAALEPAKGYPLPFEDACGVEPGPPAGPGCGPGGPSVSDYPARLRSGRR